MQADSSSVQFLQRPDRGRSPGHLAGKLTDGQEYGDCVMVTELQPVERASKPVEAAGAVTRPQVEEICVSLLTGGQDNTIRSG